MKLDDHVGKKWVRLDAEGLSPLVSGIVVDNWNGDALLESINRAVRAVLDQHFIEWEISVDRDVFRLMCEPEIIEPREERRRKHDENLEALRVTFQDADARRVAELQADPNNGKAGFWEVDGVRHNTIVQASNAPEAVEKAIASGGVGDWESPTASYIGTELPPRKDSHA